MNKVAFVCITALVSIQCGFTWSEVQGVEGPGVDEKTEIVILGTLHAGHNQAQEYTTQSLKEIVLALKPAVILVELPPSIGDKATLPENGRVADWLLQPGPKNDSPEVAVVDEAAGELGIRQLQFDREGRNEFYRQSRYSERQGQLNAAFSNWSEQVQKDAPESAEAQVPKLLMNAVAAQNRLNALASAKVINSDAYDNVIRVKHAIFHDILPKIWANCPDHKDLVSECDFFREEWHTRNGIMADNIARIAADYRGKRILVTTGSEHRYMLRDLLAKRDGIVLKEFWEVSQSR